jgi:hypothetical protein
MNIQNEDFLFEKMWGKQEEGCNQIIEKKEKPKQI